MDTVETVYLEPLDEGRRTRVHHRFKLKTPGLVYRLVLGGFISVFIKRVYQRAEVMMLVEMARLEPEPDEPSLVGHLAPGLSGDG
jgi:hypothetical protein